MKGKVYANLGWRLEIKGRTRVREIWLDTLICAFVLYMNFSSVLVFFVCSYNTVQQNSINLIICRFYASSATLANLFQNDFEGHLGDGWLIMRWIDSVKSDLRSLKLRKWRKVAKIRSDQSRSSYSLLSELKGFKFTETDLTSIHDETNLWLSSSKCS